MENIVKAVEYINHHLMTSYMEKLVKVQMDKVVLFPMFPITGAPNLSMPNYFVKIKNPEVLSELLRGSVN